MPDWGPAIRERLASVRLSPQHEAEIVEELSLHLDERVREMISGGTDADAAEVRDLVEEHRSRTGSTVAAELLDDWDAARARFVKVFPADYKRVLAEQAAAPAQTTEGVAA